MMADSSIVTLTVPGTVLAPGARLAGSVAVDSSPARTTVTLARPGLTVCPIVTLEVRSVDSGGTIRLTRLLW